MTVDGLEKLLARLDLLQILSDRLHLHEGEERNLSDVDVKKEAREVEQNETVSIFI